MYLEHLNAVPIGLEQVLGMKSCQKFTVATLGWKSELHVQG